METTAKTGCRTYDPALKERVVAEVQESKARSVAEVAGEGPVVGHLFVFFNRWRELLRISG